MWLTVPHPAVLDQPRVDQGASRTDARRPADVRHEGQGQPGLRRAASLPCSGWPREPARASRVERLGSALARAASSGLPLTDRAQVCRRDHGRPGPGLFGNGRSYGDVCLNPGGTLWAHARPGPLHRLRRERGVIECEAGLLLKDIIDRRAAAAAGSCRSTPGTQFVTVGGAIANDVHGKATMSRAASATRCCRSNLCARTAASSNASRRTRRLVRGHRGRPRPHRRHHVARACACERWPGPGSTARPCPSTRWKSSSPLGTLGRRSFEYTVSWIDCVSVATRRAACFSRATTPARPAPGAGPGNALPLPCHAAGLAGQPLVAARLQCRLLPSEHS